MKYVSDDGKIFATERECVHYEDTVRRAVEERALKQKLAAEREARVKAISKKYNELQELMTAFGKDYDLKDTNICFTPFYEIAAVLLG